MSKSSDFSPLDRTKTHSSSDSHRSDNNRYILVIIMVLDNPESERFCSGSIYIETFFNESSFIVLLSNKNVGYDRIVISLPALPVIIGDLGSNALITSEIEVATLDREDDRNFTKTCHTIYDAYCLE